MIDKDNKVQEYEDALKSKRVPLLSLDHKWHCLFQVHDKSPEIAAVEEELNCLIRKQGQLNSEIKNLKTQKQKLLNVILANMSETENQEEHKLFDLRKNVDEINITLEQYEDELLDIPYQIKEVNLKLMVMTMEFFYQILKDNENEISIIDEWFEDIKNQIKDKITIKRNRKEENNKIYSYMHDVFGMEVIDLFDMAYYDEVAEVSNKDKTAEDK